MKNQQGYFSIVQYSEKPERAEYVNIGIVVFQGCAPFVSSKFNLKPRLVQTVFNVPVGKHFELLQGSLKDRLGIEFGNGWSKEGVDKFISQRSGKIRLSPIRSVLISDIDRTVSELFDELVGEISPSPRRQRPRSKLAIALKSAGVDTLLEKPEPILLAGGVRINAPYGYQNGAFNFLEAISLVGGPEKALSAASPQMIEGNLLFNETMSEKRLIVIADGAEDFDDSFIEMLRSQMEIHKVRFLTFGKIDSLVEDIRTNYALHH